MNESTTDPADMPKTTWEAQGERTARSASRRDLHGVPAIRFLKERVVGGLCTFATGFATRSCLPIFTEHADEAAIGLTIALYAAAAIAALAITKRERPGPLGEPALAKEAMWTARSRARKRATHGGDALEQIARAIREELIELGITDSEQEVALRIMRGENYREIAEGIYYSENAVKYHAKRVFEKAHVRSRHEFEMSMRRSVEGRIRSEASAKRDDAD